MDSLKLLRNPTERKKKKPPKWIKSQYPPDPEIPEIELDFLDFFRVAPYVILSVDETRTNL